MNALAEYARRTTLNIAGSASLRASLRMGRGLAFNATLKGKGTTPPTVTLSGTSVALQDVRFRTPTTGGPRGTAKFDWSVDGGASYTTDVLTAASVVLGSSGLTANFSVGTYNTNNTWRRVVNSWVDRTGNAENFTETVGAGSQPYLSLTGLNGLPCLEFPVESDGVRLRDGNATFATSLAGGEDTPHTVFLVAQVIAVDGSGSNHPMWAVTNEVSSTAVSWFGIDSTGTQWIVDKRGDTGGSVFTIGGTADFDPHVFEYVQHGTTVELLTDGTSQISAAANASSGTFSVVTLGCELSTANLFCNCRIAAADMYAGALSANDRTYIRQNLKNEFGL